LIFLNFEKANYRAAGVKKQWDLKAIKVDLLWPMVFSNDHKELKLLHWDDFCERI